ncbi:MAG: tetratricopeptide repeat protein, partial [Acidobacteriota bacterium]|nr:tetratricopeptide repeat protein [Acidobacteriota bacterium]
MRQQRLLLAMLLVTLLGSVTVAQTGREDARDAIRRGNEKYAKAEYELAIEEYRRVLPSAGETYAQSLHNIGVCYYELWRTDEAVVYYRRAIEAREGRYPMALYSLGVALKDLRRWPEAKEAFQQSIATSGGKYAPAH